jgi:hypothetical protein
VAPLPDPPPPSLPFRLLGSASGIAALIAGGLYLAGIATLTVRMEKSGLTAGDFLPLFSLDQLLRIGLTWLVPVTPAILIAGLLYGASTAFERQLSKRAKRFQTQRAPLIEDATQRTAWEESFERLLARTDWGGVIKQVSAAMLAAPESPHIGTWRRLRRRLGLFQLWTILVMVVLYSSVSFLSPVIAFVTFVALLTTASLIDTRPARQALTPLFLVVMAAFLCHAVVNPRPLPTATVITKSTPSRHSGAFIGSSDAAWYLGSGERRVLVIPADDVVCSRLRSRPRARPLWRVVFDVQDKTPKAAALRCETEETAAQPRNAVTGRA